MSIQPFAGRTLVVIEARKPDGSLRFDCPQAPFGPHAFDDVYKLFFRDHPDAAGTWESLSAWLKSKSWSIRAKTW